MVGNWKMLAGIHRAEPGIRAGLTMPRHRIWPPVFRPAQRLWYAWRAPSMLAEYDARLMSCHRLLVSRLLVHRLHAAGDEIWVWTVDQLSEIDHLREIEVDGICSDDPASHSWEEQVAEQVAQQREKEQLGPEAEGGAGRALDGAALGVALADAVPVLHGMLAVQPAELDQLAVALAREVEQPALGVLHAHAFALQLDDRIVERAQVLAGVDCGLGLTRGGLDAAQLVGSPRSSSSTACSARSASACSRRLATTGRMSGSKAFACSMVKAGRGR